ncbi:MAG: sulfatase, partial [Deltaproteobacteria bacterium]
MRVPTWQLREGVLLALCIATALLALEVVALRLNLPGYGVVLRTGGTAATLWLRYAAVFATCGLVASVPLSVAVRAGALRRGSALGLCLAALAAPTLLYAATLGHAMPLVSTLGASRGAGVCAAALALALAALARAALRGNVRAGRAALGILAVALVCLHGFVHFASGAAGTERIPAGGPGDLRALARVAVAAGALSLPLWVALWRAHQRSVAAPLGGALVALLALLAVAVAAEAPAAARGVAVREARRPAVLLIVADTLRADFVSGFGGPDGATPRIGALARDGIVFENARAAASWTTPSFASILTSRYPSEHRAGERTGRHLRRRGMDPSLPTLAEVLGAHGYRSAAVLSNAFLFRGYGLGKGFHEYRNQRAVPRYHPVAHWLEAQRLAGFGPRYRQAYLSAEHQTARILDAIDTLRETGRPYFVLAQYMDAHEPYIAPRRFHEAGAAPPTVRDAYRAEVRHLDHALGELLDALRTRGEYDRMLIVFTADHGEELLEGRVAPLRTRHGHTLFDELLRVPLIVKLPGSRLAGTRRADPVSLVDLAPTILGALGIDAPDAFRGWNLLDASRPPDASTVRVLFAETMLSGPEQRAALRGTDKLILQVEATGAPRVAAYELGRDPNERDPRAIAGERVAPLLRALEARGARPPRAESRADAVDVDPLNR